jgi:hypothetical protein
VSNSPPAAMYPSLRGAVVCDEAVAGTAKRNGSRAQFMRCRKPLMERLVPLLAMWLAYFAGAFKASHKARMGDRMARYCAQQMQFSDLRPRLRLPCPINWRKRRKAPGCCRPRSWSTAPRHCEERLLATKQSWSCNPRRRRIPDESTRPRGEIDSLALAMTKGRFHNRRKTSQ